jgi:hypothetical protein
MGKLQASGTISMKDIVDEYETSPGSAVDINESANKYYRGGSHVPDISFTQNIPTQGEVSFSDYYDTKNRDFFAFQVPILNTQTFKAGNAVTTYRRLLTYTVNEPHSFLFDVRVRFMGDERESDCVTSTNRQEVKNPGISVYRGGSGTNTLTSAPDGTRVFIDQSNGFSNNDDQYKYENLGTYNAAGVAVYHTEIGGPVQEAGTYHVYAQMYCRNVGGPDAPLSRWYTPSFIFRARSE